jgi:hypothetical protein
LEKSVRNLVIDVFSGVYYLILHIFRARSLTLVLLIPSHYITGVGESHIDHVVNILMLPIMGCLREVGSDRNLDSDASGARDEWLDRGREGDQVRGLRSDESRVSEGRGKDDNRASDGRGRDDRIVGARGGTLSI